MISCSNFMWNLTVFWQLLKTEMFLLGQNIKDKFINQLIWSGSQLIISGYLLQALGTSESFGAFQAGSLVVSVIGFEIYGAIFNFVSDIEGIKHINYQLTLPIPNGVVFASKMAIFMINGMILSLSALPIAKLILLNKFSLSTIDYPRLFVILFVTNIFFGLFTQWLVTLIKNSSTIEDVIMRIMFPLWFFGCFQFSVKIAYTISPVFWAISLISPYSYATEAARCAILGPKDYIPFWLCITVLSLSCVVCGVWGYSRMRRKLDFI